MWALDLANAISSHAERIPSSIFHHKTNGTVQFFHLEMPSQEITPIFQVSIKFDERF